MDKTGSNSNEAEISKILKAIDYLTKLNPAEILSNPRAFNSLLFLRHSIPNLKSYEIFINKNFHYLLSDILLEIYKKRLNITKINVKKNLDINKIYAQNERTLSIMYICLIIVNIICYDSVYFMKKFFSFKGLEIHLIFLEDLNFVQQLSCLNISNNGEYNYTLIELLVLGLNRFSSDTEYLSKWIELNAVNILMMAPKFMIFTRTDFFLTIANVVCDKQIETMEGIKEIITYIHLKLNDVAEDFKKSNFNRKTMRIYENDTIKDHYIHCIVENQVLKPLSGFFSALYRLAINEKIRNIIYFENNFYENLKTILFNGNKTEAIYALRLFAQLSFNYQISNDLSEKKDFLEFINNNSHIEIKQVVKLCDLIFWNIKNQNTEENKIDGEHLMISYNSLSRNYCLKIKNELEMLGYKVWIDVEKDRASCLESMTKGIKESFCVLACLTEKYRESVKCQAEIKYAQYLNKPIIPLILQKGYENIQGWPKKIVTSRTCINFTKFKFIECIEQIEKQIQRQLSNDNEKFKCQMVFQADNWNEMEIKNWFELNNLNIKIYQLYLPFDAKILKQVYYMSIDTPEFLYQSLKMHGIDMESIQKFCNCLKILFSLN